jgi:hypothetical protein
VLEERTAIFEFRLGFTARLVDSPPRRRFDASMAPPKASELGLPPPRRLELCGAALILLAALVPRLRDAASPFDREAEGAQAAFFAIAAVNYERLGIGSAGGYPVLNVDALRESRPGAWLPFPSESWLVYANHPPLVPLLAWAALETLGPGGWNQAWRAGRPPAEIELPLRLPFALCHAAFLVALWWAARESHGARTAMIALALAAAMPVLAFYGTLVNYENPALLCLALAAGFHARWQRAGRAADLGQFALFCLAGSCVTYAGAFFVPFFALATLAAGYLARGVAQALAGGAAALVPLAAHALWSSRVGERLGQALPSPAQRAREILNPLFDGSLPVASWGARQVGRMGTWIGWPILALALAGLCLLLARLARPVPAPAFAPRGWRRVDIGAPLLFGGGLYLISFYAHSYGAEHPFLMLVAPGFAVLAAVALDALAVPLARLRAGIAPLVVLVSSIALLGVLEINAQRYRYRSAAGEPAPDGLEAPAFPLPDVTGAEIASLMPPGSFGLYPSDAGLNLAVTFYAWRSLLPIDDPEDPAPAATARQVGLEAAPRYLLLPAPPPPEAADQTADLRASLVPAAAPRQTGARWESVRLP